VTDAQVMRMATEAMLMTAKLAGPILLVSLAIGLTVSLIQSVTQLQEVTLTFVPKLAGVALVLIVAGHWMLSQMVGYTQNLFGHAAALIGG
jgi:flagellar biosynthetic protein FliQ